MKKLNWKLFAKIIFTVVELPCHISHDIDEVIIASHALFEFFRKLGSVAGLTNKSVMYDDHINSIWFVNNRTAGQR